MEKIRVVMVGADRSVHGGVSAVVNNYYKAGLDRKVRLTYLGTMVDGSKFRKLVKAIGAYLRFLLLLPGFDILHVNMAADTSFYRKRIFIHTASRWGKKILIHAHGGDFRSFYYKKSGATAQKRIRDTLNKAHTFVVLSRQWVEFFAPLLDTSKMVVLENAVSIPPVGKRDYAGQNLLFLGRLCREKGVGELLAVLPQIAARFPDVKLYLGGIWTDRELAKKAAELGDLVTYLGWIGEEEKQKYMAHCSIFVLPTYFEGQPVSLLEAMAAGMAVLTTAVGGIPQVIETGVQGLLINPRDEEALATGLTTLLADERVRRQYGEAARKKVREEHDIVRSVEKLVEIYRGMMRQ